MATLTRPGTDPHHGAEDAFCSVRDLRVSFSTEDGVLRAVDGVSFDLERGRTLGIVGESGSGKSVTALTLLGLHHRGTTTVTGEIHLAGQELLRADERALERMRGNTMAMVFQDPLTALSPYHTVGRQIAEPYIKHRGASRRQARTRAIEMLERVGIPQPRLAVDDYPHQFSGGMRQRAVIAMALVCDPDLLIADEPTTALDVTVQAQILDLLSELQQRTGMAVLFITHDLGVVAHTADELLVMYAGRVAERGPVREVLQAPEHPYTWGLLSSTPRLSASVDIPLTPIPGSPPSLLDPPVGCSFHPRCALRDEVEGSRCSKERPPLAFGEGRNVACHLEPRRRRALFAENIGPRLK